MNECPLIDKCEDTVTDISFEAFCRESAEIGYKRCPTYIRMLIKHRKIFVQTPREWKKAKIEINLTLVTGFKEAGKDLHLKCLCGKPATHQLEEEHDGLANPITYLCLEDAEKTSKKYGIPIQTVVLNEEKEES
ncbi:unnamed protein product [marine sediment metagenome]|uniref:Uncharacterized protein n=1 Tax=marine sediment metagenome TaxID=412755 RepID=X1MXH1_9ZZZZ